MKILIIGGAGYIGSHQVKMMLDYNYEVVVYDNLSTGFKEMVDSRAIFVEGDIRNYDLLKQTLVDNDIEFVMHFAALSLVGQSMDLPLEYYDNNVYGFQVLLQAMRDTAVDKIVFSSSAAVYGEQSEMPIVEKAAANPTNVYGETKLAMERMIFWAAQAYNLNYVILRYFNVAGAQLDGTLGELHNPETHLIPLVLQVALNKRDYIEVYGTDYNSPDGTCYRDYIHVVDLCDAHRLAVDYLLKKQPSEIFNLGYGHGFSVLEIIESVRKVTQHQIPVVNTARREGDPALLIASATKAQNILKWLPQYDDIEVIVSSAHLFYQKQL